MQVTLPPDASVHGHSVDAVLGYLTISTGLAFGVMATILMAAVLFHRGRGRLARYTHGNGARDRWVAAVAGAVVLFGIDAVAVVRSSDQLRGGFWKFPDDDARAVRVEVTAQQWAWTFRYPGADGLFNTNDDVFALNQLRVPVDRPVYLQLTSKDVVHALYLPNFRNKVDAIPGAVTRMWFQPRVTGTFEIGCAQHCGAWHYKMRGELTVMDAHGFESWFERAAADTALLRDGSAKSADSSAREAASAPHPVPAARPDATPTGAGGEAINLGDSAASNSDGWTWNRLP